MKRLTLGRTSSRGNRGRARLTAILAAAIIASGAWALASNPAAADAHEPILLDPAGDAYETTPRDAAQNWWNACYMAAALPQEACDNTTHASAALPSAGPPAPPGRDLVALRMSETPTHLVVEIDVARLDAGLSQALPRDDVLLYWAACWSNMTECAYASASRAGGRIGHSGFLGAENESCGDGGFCIQPVPMTIAPGTPGTLRLDVPRALLLHGEAGARLDDVALFVGAFDTGVGMADWSAATPLRTTGGHLMLAHTTVDVATGGRPFDFLTPSESLWSDLIGASREDEDGDVENREAIADADIRSVSIRENETSIALAVEMGRLNESAPAMTTGIVFGLATGPSIRVYVDDMTDTRQVAVMTCGDRACSYRVQAPARVDLVEGAPGWINVTFRRSDLGHPPAETRVTNLHAMTWVYDSRSARPGPMASVGVDAMRIADQWAFGPYYALQMDGVRPPDDARRDQQAVVVRDLADDVAEDRPGVDAEAGMYDLVLVAVEGTSPTSTRVTLGVRDLSRITVPAGSKAVVYSAALATERGDYIVGFYKDAQRGDFFCATDSLVITDDKRDPAEAAWSIIEGVLTVGGMGASSAPGGTASSPSTLTVFVPHACFGTEEPGPIAARALVGAIHLIPQSPAAGVPLEEIWLADEARDDGITAFSLGAPVPEGAAPAWYAQPFGIENFWDITGILLAAAVSGAGVLAVRRKRTLLQRYLDQIDRVIAAHPEESREREAGLLDIRRRLKQDLVHGRIVEAHYLVVEHRLNEQLIKVRMRNLTDAFGDLPHRLLHKLLEILADGTITREESRRFGALLEDSGLTTDARERIRRKLDLWVVEDAPTPS